MSKRLLMVLVVLMAGSLVGGCRFASPALEALSGSGCTKTQQIIRHQARNARKGEAFIDQYFLNYAINDPYRGDLFALDGCDR